MAFWHPICDVPILSDDKIEDTTTKQNTDAELYCNLTCALTHSIDTCDKCKKCKGDNGVAIRLELIKELADRFNLPYPWREEE